MAAAQPEEIEYEPTPFGFPFAVPKAHILRNEGSRQSDLIPYAAPQDFRADTLAGIRTAMNRERNRDGRYDSVLAVLQFAGLTHVGRLKGTNRMVFAGAVSEIVGCGRSEHRDIWLVATPFKKVDDDDGGWAEMASDVDVTDQYGLRGFHPWARVLNWDIVKVKEDLWHDDILYRYRKVYDRTGKDVCWIDDWDS